MHVGQFHQKPAQPAIGIKIVLIHPNFKIDAKNYTLRDISLSNDVWAKNLAVVVLNQTLPLSPRVHPACLPQPHQMDGLDRDRKSATLAGWVLTKT